MLRSASRPASRALPILVLNDCQHSCHHQYVQSSQEDVPIEKAQQIQQREERNETDVHLPQQPLCGFGVIRDMIIVGLCMLKLRNLRFLKTVATFGVRHIWGTDIDGHVR